MMGRRRRSRRRGLGKVGTVSTQKESKKSKKSKKDSRKEEKSPRKESTSGKGRRPRRNVGRIQRELARNHLAHPHLYGRDVILRQAILPGGRPP